MKALTVKQPWAWLIIHGGKNIENRTWRTPHRGPLLIQASARVDNGLDLLCDNIRHSFNLDIPAKLDQGGIVGSVDVIDCVTSHPSPWFEGPIGWLLDNPMPLPFIPIRGKLYVFDAPPEVEEVYRIAKRSK